MRIQKEETDVGYISATMAMRRPRDISFVENAISS